ncbi:hypothetical protein GUJ93_ZPchr0006g43950 [Zizania palustris]|uniref:Beta-amylase n=1 Tax=Zizania palustris TaxID=103762 RepID=A0A8J5TAH0_ZIZPA|nr:hypothetical protein GUJ93_ZPchr0006g43950 [Zizania palustris]
MVYVWWGIVESESPSRYNFDGYMELMEMARKTGIKVHADMSFHQCGGNVSDSVKYATPGWPSRLVFCHVSLVFFLPL